MSDQQTIKTLGEYVEYLQSKCDPEDIVFRGQSQWWDPCPKIARPTLKFKGPPHEAERRMFEQFRREASPFTDGRTNDWDLLAIAQHHGLPTRLMDWTKNALAALWFVVRHPSKGGEDGVVWVYSFDEQSCCDPTVVTSPFDCQAIQIYRPAHVHRRLTAQFGWFTVHPFDGNGYLPITSCRATESLTELIIPAGAFADIRKHLDRCGVNASTMFPGLDGICENVEWVHSLVSDEQPA